MKFVDKLKIKFTMFMLRTIQNMVKLNVRMMDLKVRSKEYLKHPTAEGFKIKNETTR